MSWSLVILTGLIYLYCAAEQWMKGAPGTAIMFAGYAAANVGVYLQSK